MVKMFDIRRRKKYQIYRLKYMKVHFYLLH